MRVSSCSFCCETKQLNKWTLNTGGLDQEIGNIGQYHAAQIFTRAYRITAVETASWFSCLPPAALQTHQNMHLYVNSDRKEQYW